MEALTPLEALQSKFKKKSVRRQDFPLIFFLREFPAKRLIEIDSYLRSGPDFQIIVPNISRKEKTE
jgi:hypothetical protein